MGPDPSADTGEQSLAVAATAGIHCLQIPTPFLVGRVNCYLIEDDPLTLVDTGPNSGKSLDTLTRALAAHGRQIEDLELIVITHQHVDHLGLLEILARRSQAEVAALGPLAPYLQDFSASAAADDQFALAIMRRHGVPADLATVLGSVSAAYRSYGSNGNVNRRLGDGDQLTLRDRSLRVLHRPGHSPSDTIFFDEARQILIAGDHLLARISSNPLLSRPLSDRADGGRPHALVDYMASMRATRELPARLVLTGHGPPITDHVALIEERFRGHERRARKLLRMLAGGPLSAYELAQEMWGNVAVTQAYLTISEVLGHIDLLIDRGAVGELDDGQLIRFQALGAPI
jgi:glyoxylase-like metal-dependent hydrolase (beta-lactamase superfamily II)